jgi:hypothetical protein
MLLSITYFIQMKKEQISIEYCLESQAWAFKVKRQF